MTSLMLNYVNIHCSFPAAAKFAGALLSWQEPGNVARSDRTHALAWRCAR
jgi:hypothetical protein